MLRNDISWGLLSQEEKNIILDANRSHNIHREDYSDPEKYGCERMSGGDNFDSAEERATTERGAFLLQVLDELKPAKVLEIGPGAGFYTKTICEYPSVEKYTAIDINQAFLDYLEPRLQGIKKSGPFSFELICGDPSSCRFKEKFDLVVLLSAVHHIPDRRDLFAGLKGMLNEGGAIFCFDPSHYLIRISTLAFRCFTSKYLTKGYYMQRTNLSTHHMCTYGEYRKIVHKVGGLKISGVRYLLPDKIRKLRIFNTADLLQPYLSTEIGIVIRKESA